MKKNAFSLIELSIVILVIGIIIAGVTSSSRLVKQFRIQSAQSLTKSSPVIGIKDLVLWYETSLSESFSATEIANVPSTGSQISAWYDLNSQQLVKNNAAQSTSTAQPKYYEDVLNGLPAVRFDGISDFMSFDGATLVGNNYTVFIVEQRRSAASALAPRALICGATEATNSSLVLAYIADTTLNFGHYNNDNPATVVAYSSPFAAMHTFRFSKTDGKQYWSNGGLAADAQSSVQTTALTSFAGAQIGRWFNYNSFYNGDIFEIIIFSNSLGKEDRQSVESYLSKKYNIKIT